MKPTSDDRLWLVIAAGLLLPGVASACLFWTGHPMEATVCLVVFVGALPLAEAL